MSIHELIGELGYKVGIISLTLGTMHGLNLWLATFLPKILNNYSSRL